MPLLTGLVPPDPTTEVGRLRILVGDVDAVVDPDGELGPTTEGEYTVFGDLQLAAFLFEGGNVLRGAALAIRRLAVEYSAAGQSIRTDDLQIDLRSRGRDLREVAESFSAEAAEWEDANGQGAGTGRPGMGPDVFIVAPGRPMRMDYL